MSEPNRPVEPAAIARTIRTPVLWLVAVGFSFQPVVAAAATCESDSIARVAPGGETIEMRSGKMFQIEPGDRVLAASWPPVSDMLICLDPARDQERPAELYGLINRDDDGQSVAARRVSR
jgi:hypothetical protein